MKKKKCITLASQLVVFILVMALALLNPFGAGNVEAALQSDDSFIQTRQADYQIYGISNLLQMQAVSSTSGGSSEIIQGDINNDGDVNSIDFAHMKMYLLGMSNSMLTKDKITIADLNMDKKFNSIDLALMRGYLLGQISGFPSGNSASPKPAATPTPKTSSTAAPSPSTTSDDFTDTISKASYKVAVGEEVKGVINYDGDKDYLLFKPSENGKYRVNITTNPDTVRGFLYALKIEGLDYYYSSYKTYVIDTGCYIEEVLSGNTEYYIGIKSVTGSTSLDTYTIKITKVK
ncbi:MAG: Endoglucanase E precursor [Firmicutes bacterium ADurb.Bin419]|nr:MAG: Endoglucanase E precursor [Firmicutes bacterium ADurb.Bin419]